MCCLNMNINWYLQAFYCSLYGQNSFLYSRFEEIWIATRIDNCIAHLSYITLLKQLEMLYFVIHVFLASIKCLHSHTAVLFWRLSKLENPVYCARDLKDFQIEHSSQTLMSSSFSSLGTRHFDLVPPPPPWMVKLVLGFSIPSIERTSSVGCNFYVLFILDFDIKYRFVTSSLIRKEGPEQCGDLKP